MLGHSVVVTSSEVVVVIVVDVVVVVVDVVVVDIQCSLSLQGLSPQSTVSGK